MNENVYSVTQLNQHVKTVLNGDPSLQRVWLRGELSSYKSYPSGYRYFNLKDEQSNIRCVMFSGRLDFTPRDGMEVTVYGKVDLFLRDGTYQLQVYRMSQQGTGELYAAYEALKARLEAEGLFDSAHKKPLPKFPKRIAVITSGSGRAVHDVIKATRIHWPLAKIVVMSVQVEGPGAPEQIVGALRYADQWRVADVIICGRGGGGIEKLWTFNDERIARAIYACETPVVSAVGHEADTTIADFVADFRAGTPTMAGDKVVPDQNEQRGNLAGYALRADQAMRRRLESARQRLNDLASRRMLQSPTGYIEQKRMELDMETGALLRAQERLIAADRQRYVRLAAALDAMSPLKTLQRGYAVAADDAGRVLRRVGDAEVGQDINVTLNDGSLRCRVKERKEN